MPTYSFSTKLTTNTPIDGNPVVYDQVNLNVGGAYNANTGIKKFSWALCFYLPIYLINIDNVIDDCGIIYEQVLMNCREVAPV